MEDSSGKAACGRNSSPEEVSSTSPFSADMALVLDVDYNWQAPALALIQDPATSYHFSGSFLHTPCGNPAFSSPDLPQPPMYSPVPSLPYELVFPSDVDAATSGTTTVCSALAVPVDLQLKPLRASLKRDGAPDNDSSPSSAKSGVFNSITEFSNPNSPMGVVQFQPSGKRIRLPDKGTWCQPQTVPVHQTVPQTTTTTTTTTTVTMIGPALNTNGKPRAKRGSATDPQSVYARHRRERINERLKTLQHLVPNGAKVDIVTMLEEAIHYVKFLQLQVSLLSSDEYWIYAPTAYNGIETPLGINLPMRG